MFGSATTERERLTVTQVEEHIQAFFTRAEVPYQTTETAAEYLVRAGSTALLVRAQAHTLNGAESTIVIVMALVLKDVPLSPSLFRYVALKAGGYAFGTLYVDEQGENLGSICFEYSILADYLDDLELDNAIRAVAAIADELDDEMQMAFGGRRATD